MLTCVFDFTKLDDNRIFLTLFNIFTLKKITVEAIVSIEEVSGKGDKVLTIKDVSIT